jgi:hypothetical protein
MELVQISLSKNEEVFKNSNETFESDRCETCINVSDEEKAITKN